MEFIIWICLNKAELNRKFNREIVDFIPHIDRLYLYGNIFESVHLNKEDEIRILLEKHKHTSDFIKLHRLYMQSILL